MNRPNQPMGNAGAVPGPGIFQEAAMEAAGKKVIAEYTNAFSNAGAMMEDKNLVPVITIVARELEEIINDFLKQNERAQVCLKIIATIRNVLEVAPEMAARKVEKILGKQLTELKGLTPPPQG
jgi:hypothetical protein